MGQFSWFTQDTNHRIVADEPYRVYMSDDKGNHYIEECYEGYGVFGGKDYYELLAEMNGLTLEQFNGDNDALRDAGIDLAFKDSPSGRNPNIKHPSLTERGWYCNGEAPESDPNQGFSDNEIYGDYEDEEDYE